MEPLAALSPQAPRARRPKPDEGWGRHTGARPAPARPTWCGRAARDPGRPSRHASARESHDFRAFWRPGVFAPGGHEKARGAGATGLYFFTRNKLDRHFRLFALDPDALALVHLGLDAAFAGGIVREEDGLERLGLF